MCASRGFAALLILVLFFVKNFPAELKTWNSNAHFCTEKIDFVKLIDFFF